MQDKIKAKLNENIEVKKRVINSLLPQVETATNLIIAILKSGNKIMLCGNGGSAADAQHLAGEFIGRYLKERKSLPAIALTTDTSILTCLGNDYGFDNIFSRQVEGLAKKGDILIGISTSGNSKNVLLAIEKAKKMGCKTIALLGGSGGEIIKAADLSITIPTKITPRVQECHITIGHIICGLVEEELA
ncbi:MAG: D-sedoheptulose 7-phosphate isomerase [Candidatus Saganbacteria bacterium]|nr:D-sedoheptulose 7-phosphate isomerase [Candidatus Saganbacteria bacterium]